MGCRTPETVRRGAALPDEEPEEGEDDPTEGDRRADASLTPEDLHRDRGARLAVVADTAPPRFVAADVRVLLLQRLIARPRTASTGIAIGDQRDARDPQQQIQRDHDVDPPSRRARTASWTRAALAWPRVAFITWPTKKPST